MTASTSGTQVLVTKTPKRKHVFVLAVVGVFLGVAAIIWGTYSLFFAGVNSGPSLVEELRAGTLTGADIKSIEVLKFNPGAGWPFSETEYARKARKGVGSSKTKEIIGVLRNSSSSGYKHRNHPSTFYHGILRIDLVEGGHYYAFYCLGYCNSQYYVYLDVNSKNSTNPNSAEEYENIRLQSSSIEMILGTVTRTLQRLRTVRASQITILNNCRESSTNV